ncbi:MAG: Rid family detoxifying hydrolase [bacterium]|nr:Rid family detoxifying hydrolase [bacterium]
MKKSIQTTKAPTAVGPYSQAVQVGNTVYISGQIPLDPQTNTGVEGNIAVQTKQIFKNIEEIIKAADPKASFQNIVKTTVFLTNLEDFTKVNEVYNEIFNQPYPARSTVQVAALPKNAQIEIEAIAII